MISRKKFLRLTGLGIASSLVPNLFFSKVFALPISGDVNTLLKTAKKLRKQGRLSQAKSKYQEVLQIDPKEIRAYNGIRKILLNKKGQELQVIQLYQQAVNNIPSELRIKRKLYSEYTKAALGNRNVAGQLNIPNRILVYVKERYEEMLSQNYPNQKNLQKQLDKINKYIELNVDAMDNRKNKALKTLKKGHRKAHKDRLKNLTVQESTQALAKLIAKPIVDDRKLQIRQMTKVNIASLRAEKRYSDAFQAALDYLTANNNSDPYFIKQFRELSKQLKNYDQLLTFELSNHEAKNTFWSALALFDVHLKRAESQMSFDENSINSLIQALEDKSSDPNQNFEVATRKAKLYLIKNNFQAVKPQLLALCKQKIGVTDAHSIDRVNLLIAKYYIGQGNSSNKKEILEIANSPLRYVDHQDELVKYTALMNLKRSLTKPIHMQQLQQNINNLQ